jgi:hypothetical protein
MTGLRLRRAAIAALVLLSAGLAGCGGSGRATVGGTVTYDGLPIDNGGITFVPEDKSAKMAGGTITEGKYFIDAEHGPAPGKYRVEITWTRPTGSGKKGDPDLQGPGSGDTKQVLPDKFNKSSTLTAEIKSGSNTIDFPLKSK